MNNIFALLFWFVLVLGAFCLLVWGVLFVSFLFVCWFGIFCLFFLLVKTVPCKELWVSL